MEIRKQDETIEAWMPRVSVMIPLYNVELFVGRCLASVFSQAYPSWEVVIVDDGSTDGTLAEVHRMIEQYEVQDRVSLLALSKNGGVAAARNLALSRTQGDYLLWIDGDDYWDNENVMGDWVSVAVQEKAQVVISPYIADFPRRQVLFSVPPITDPRELVRSILDGRTPGFLWNKLILREHFIRYISGWTPGNDVLEDVEVLVPLLYQTQRIAYLSSPTLHYEQGNSSSCMTSLREERCQQMVAVAEGLTQFFEQEVQDPAMAQYVRRMYLSIQKMLYVRITPKSYGMVRDICPSISTREIAFMPWRIDEKLFFYWIHFRYFSALGYGLIVLERWIKRLLRGGRMPIACHRKEQ